MTNVLRYRLLKMKTVFIKRKMESLMFKQLAVLGRALAILLHKNPYRQVILPQKRRKNLFLKSYLKLNQEKIKLILDRPYLHQVLVDLSKTQIPYLLKSRQRQELPENMLSPKFPLPLNKSKEFLLHQPGKLLKSTSTRSKRLFQHIILRTKPRNMCL